MSLKLSRRDLSRVFVFEQYFLTLAGSPNHHSEKPFQIGLREASNQPKKSGVIMCTEISAIEFHELVLCVIILARIQNDQKRFLHSSWLLPNKQREGLYD
jgi:hypothetical protein